MTSRDIGEGIIATWSDRTLTLSLSSNPEVFIVLSPYLQSALNAFILECLDKQSATRPINQSPKQPNPPI